MDCKEIQPVHPKADQSWVFIGRTDVEAETPILWPPDVKSPLATLLEGKAVRRQLVRDDKLYVLALDAANEPYIYLADLANDTVMTLDSPLDCKEIQPVHP